MAVYLPSWYKPLVEYNTAERLNGAVFVLGVHLAGFFIGKSVAETKSPVHLTSGIHYLDVEHVGHETQLLATQGLESIIQDSMVSWFVRRKYNFSMFAQVLSSRGMDVLLSLENRKGEVLAQNSVTINSDAWKKYTATLTAKAACDSASLVVLIQPEGKLALDMVSLFPEKTFKNRTNGLRADWPRFWQICTRNLFVFPVVVLFTATDSTTCIVGKTPSDRSNNGWSNAISGAIIKQRVWGISNIFSFAKILEPSHFRWFLQR